MRIGFLSLPLMGHLNPMTALARKVQSRGHEVLFFGVPDVEPIAEAANLTFIGFGEDHFPIGSIDRTYAPVARLQGDDVLRQHMAIITTGVVEHMLNGLHEKLKTTPIDGMVIDKGCRHMELVAMSLGIPFVHIWNTLHMDPTGATPPCIFDWPYSDTPEARERNLEGLQQIGALLAPAIPIAKAFADRVGLAVDWNNPKATSSPLAEIAQIPREFDFPDIPWPPTFHYTGPFHDGGGRSFIPFPWEQLDDRPLIYASLGTLVNGIDRIYNTILQAVEGVDSFQVVLSIGKNVKLSDLRPIPSNTIVVPSAPQMELLARAALCITHAGMNTTLECLARGVPMVACPVSYDQPGIAARIAHHGVGKFLSLDQLNSHALKCTMQKVLSGPGYRERAKYFRQVVAETRGLDLAASIVERAFNA